MNGRGNLARHPLEARLDGYNQLDLITGKGPSARHEIFYFTEGTLSAVRVNDYKYRFTDQPSGWLGPTEKVDWPILTNLRLDPYERTGTFREQEKEEEEAVTDQWSRFRRIRRG